MCVSIPAGFSDALRLNPSPQRVRAFHVSIPAGFSDALRLTGTGYFRTVTATFQSLLGFLMRCDAARKRESWQRFTKFQSLLGFLMRCDYS